MAFSDKIKQAALRAALKLGMFKQAPAADVLESLPEPFRGALLSMYSGQLQRGSDGELHALDPYTRTAPKYGMWLYESCRRLKPRQTLEVGLAFGFSTVYFLAAVHENGSGLHAAIDPLQDYWHGIGLRHAENLGMAHAFRFYNEKSVSALVKLAADNQRFELIFIDGNHRFDDVLVDFTLSAEICPLGGYIVLDDVRLPSIRRVESFILNNRADFSKISTPLRGIVAFQRTGDDAREWRHHVDF
jgi:predicted O-methyltransferase YrrM